MKDYKTFCKHYELDPANADSGQQYRLYCQNYQILAGGIADKK